LGINAGQTAFITGGAAGIGFSVAKALAARGVNVMLADLDQARLDSAAEQVRALGVEAEGVVCDVASEAQMRSGAEATIARFGKVHIIVNNAGVATSGAAGSIPMDDWRWITGINLMGVVHGTEIFLPLIQSHGEGGHIVNTASMAGHVAAPRMSPYNATKFAVVGYTEAVKAELAGGNIGVSLLCPAWVKTDIHKSIFSKPSGGASAGDAQYKQMEAVIGGGLDADDVGEWTAQCMAQDRFYIFTHPEFAGYIAQRHAAIMADYDACKGFAAFGKT
jgi:NAD(P)-dependent dehydrogenase (short-subunit alcohol dehydrogenase family)